MLPWYVVLPVSWKLADAKDPFLCQHQARFPAAEYATLQENIHYMVEALDAAVHQCNDPPDSGPVLTTGRRVRMGKQGRPCIEIELNYLLQSFRESGDSAYQEVSMAADCSGRSVWRQRQDYGHLPWGDPVYTHEAPAGEDGELRRHFHGRGRPPTSTLTDEQLDALLSQCLQDFPKFGRRKIAGYLRDRGHHVPDRRLRESYVRVHGAPAIFGDRNIHRKRYHVAGANSLWHHDGQHGESGSMATRVTMTDLPWAVGLIRYKIVIHAFVDGKSHLVTGIQASNNNRGTTVLLLFHRCRSKHGTPSRLRGDHGTENLRIAEWMLENRGPGRGSYIFGR